MASSETAPRSSSIDLITYLDRKAKRGIVRWLWAGLLLVCFACPAWALDPNRLVSEYVREGWDAERGFPGGSVHAIAQTPDGYLWLGSENGLVRFDGLNFRLFNHRNSPGLPDAPIIDLMTDAEGNLWVRPQSRNMLLFYRDEVFHDVMPQLDSTHSSNGVTAMCRGTKGEAVFALLGTGIIAYSQGIFSNLTPVRNLPNLLTISMAVTADSRLWMGTSAGLFFVSEGKTVPFERQLPDKKINSLLAGPGRELWIGTDNGVVRWNPDASSLTEVSDLPTRIQTLAMITDRDSNVWIGASSGLLRLNDGGVAALEGGNRGSATPANAIFEDREGNLWIGNTRGIERMRSSAFMTYRVSGDPSSEGNGAVYVDADGRTWFAPLAGGLFWRSRGQTGQVRYQGLDHDVVYSLAGSGGELWIGRRLGGLTHLMYKDGAFTTQTYTHSAGLVQDSISAVHLSRDGTVWAGSTSRGLSRFKDGRFTTYTAGSTLTSNAVTCILESSDGTMWFGTANGLNSMSKGTWAQYGSMDGLPPGRVNCLSEDSNGSVWIGTDDGIAVLYSGHIQAPREAPASLREPILGLAGDRNGELWISTTNHIIRVSTEKLLGGVIADNDVREFGVADGLASVEGVRRHKSVVADRFGRIWFSTYHGLSVVDPSQIGEASVPAMALVEGITPDGIPVDIHRAVKISSARQRITFSYAGLSLAVPERVRFRYRLDGFDQDWSDPVSTREAVYTNLSPGSYRFRVIASNSVGQWNSNEASLAFEIEPLFWQTWWFKVCCAVVLMLAVFAFFSLRLRQVTARLNVRFEERLAERTRIAQELHDTLLQGFLSASMQLDVAADHLPANLPEKPQISRILELMRQVIEEGRNAVTGLRSPAGGVPSDLEDAFSTVPQELVLDEHIGFRVIAEGRKRPLHPVIRDEIYRIGREALVNAFRHSRAKHIEVEVEYAVSQFRVLVRDDGRGIDSKVLESGREGHWGLPGMRERAEAIGGRLMVWSRAGSGTEIELSLPGHVAFETQHFRLPNALFRRRRKTAERQTPD
ncbi:MAG TPA: two-component regulator propeller domain-containing protein [Blastocatellia bacterium]|nr:two-component regulator propeller domain-containing protein [Blastocatellia bacterium]